MALTEIERSLCNSLRQKYEPIISPIENTKDSFKSRIADFETLLRSTSFSPQGDVTQAVSDLQTQTQAITPGDTLSDMEKLKNFINSCEFLSGANPVATMIGSVVGLYDKIDSYIDNLGLTVPELGLAKLADTLNKLLSGAGIPGGSNISTLFGQADRLIQCVSNLCLESEYQVWVIAATDTLDGLYADFNVVSDPLDPNYGYFNYTSVYTDIGLNVDQIANINIAIDGVTSIKNDALSAVNSTISSIKSLIPGGFF